MEIRLSKFACVTSKIMVLSADTVLILPRCLVKKTEGERASIADKIQRVYYLSMTTR